MKRIAIFVLLAAWSVAWSIPARAQGISIQEYERQTQVLAKRQEKLNRKNAKKQQKMMKKAGKNQRKAMKQYQKSQRNSSRKLNHH